MKCIFQIYININGVFACHIENPETKKLLWLYTEDEWNEYYIFKGHLPYTDTGYLKDIQEKDMSELKKYLVQQGILKEDHELIYGGETEDCAK